MGRKWVFFQSWYVLEEKNMKCNVYQISAEIWIGNRFFLSIVVSFGRNNICIKSYQSHTIS